jgi:hypothetical protein
MFGSVAKELTASIFRVDRSKKLSINFYQVTQSYNLRSCTLALHTNTKCCTCIPQNLVIHHKLTDYSSKTVQGGLLACQHHPPPQIINSLTG